MEPLQLEGLVRVFIGRVVEDAFEPPQVPGRRIGGDEMPARGEHAGKFPRAEGGKDVVDEVGAPVRERQREEACDREAAPAAAAGRVPDGGLRQVDAEEGGSPPRPFQRFKEAGGVIALSAARVEDAGRVPAESENRPVQRVGERGVAAAVEEPGAPRDHLRVVPRVGAALLVGEQKVDIALRGDVEGVPLRAPAGVLPHASLPPHTGQLYKSMSLPVKLFYSLYQPCAAPSISGCVRLPMRV